jgi:hypothetical protein
MSYAITSARSPSVTPLELPDARPIYARLRGEAAPTPHVQIREPSQKAHSPKLAARRGFSKRTRYCAAEGPKSGALVEAAAQEAAIPKRRLLVAADALACVVAAG